MSHALNHHGSRAAEPEIRATHGQPTAEQLVAAVAALLAARRTGGPAGHDWRQRRLAALGLAVRHRPAAG